MAVRTSVIHMVSLGVQHHTYNAYHALTTWAWEGESEFYVCSLGQLSYERVEPNTTIYNVAVSACERDGR